MEAHTAGAQSILIVEDEPDNREIMRTIAEEMLGFRAILAEDGEVAVKLAATERPSVILMDLMIPVVDGFEAIERLRANPATSAIPIVALSALSRPTDRERALGLGANDYLSKPFDLDVLMNILAPYAAPSPLTPESNQ